MRTYNDNEEMCGAIILRRRTEEEVKNRILNLYKIIPVVNREDVVHERKLMRAEKARESSK